MAHLTGSHQQFAHLSSNACSKRGNLCSAPALERPGFTKSSRAKCASYASMQRCEAVLQVAASGETFAEASLVSSTHHHNRPVEGEYRYAARALNRYKRSDAACLPQPSGCSARVSKLPYSDGRTLETIKRMVLHVTELVKIGWNAKTEDLPNGVRLTVITSDPKELTKLKALPSCGSWCGGHHRPPHLMMAKGQNSARAN